MSAKVDHSKLFKPFLPSLSHLALVQVTFPLFNTFGADLICEANEGLEREESSEAHEGFEREESPESNEESSRENSDENYKTVKEILKKIPKCFRWELHDVAYNIEQEVIDWKDNHPSLGDVECVFHWKCIGMIDRIKTAEQFVQNANNDLRKRFEMACMYCFKESILALWEEMKVSGDAEHFDAADESIVVADESIVAFWVRWIRNGSRVPWTQALLEIDSDKAFSSIKNYSSFFPSLQSEERREFIRNIHEDADWEDFRLCLYSLTKDEEELLLQRDPERFLYLYFEWPLRSLFLETAEQIIKYYDGETYKSSVEFMLNCRKKYWFPGDVEMFQCFWDMSPDQLKDVVKKSPDFFSDIQDEFLNEMRKRKAEVDELINSARKKLKKE